MWGGDKPDSVPLTLPRAVMIISLPATFAWCGAAGSCEHAGATNTRELPAPLARRRAGQAASSLFCLAPHGVFRASPVARRAVGFYPAFSPLPSRGLRHALAV